MPKVAIDGNGNLVVAWSPYGEDGDNTGVYLRQFTWSGPPLGGERAAAVTTAGPQNVTSIRAGANGAIVAFETFARQVRSSIWASRSPTKRSRLASRRLLPPFDRRLAEPI